MKHFSHPLISRLDLAVLLGVLFAVLMGNIAVFGQECVTLRQDVVRLHILANSDSQSDQSLKLLVRDRILQDVGSVFSLAATKQGALALAQQNLPRIEQAARDVLAENGVEEPVHAELCRMYFTTRQYGDIQLPAGDYDTVRVTIGAGEGHNWWCVMYPPMCIPAAAADTVSRMPVMQEIDHLNQQPLFTPKLAVVELVEKWLGK